MKEQLHTVVPDHPDALVYVDYKPTRYLGYVQVFSDRNISPNGEDARGVACALKDVGMFPLIARRNSAIPWGYGNRCTYVPSERRGAALKIINELMTEIR